MKKEHIHTFSLIDPDKGKEEGGGIREDVTFKKGVNFWARRTFQKKNFLRKFPFLTWLPEYNVSKLVADIIAGLTLGLTTIPQVLGVANVAEMPPEYGLYSSFIGNFVYILFGSTKYITVGPTVTTAIVTLSYTRGLPPQFSVLLCFLTGVGFLLMSFLQLGFIVNFISKPVISGFTSAAAISIAATQVKALLGLSFSANGFLEEVKGIVENIEDTRWQDSLVAVVSIGALYFLMKIELIFARFNFGPKVKKCLWLLSTSRSVSVVVVATVIFGIIGGDPSPVLLVGDVPSGLPEVKPPPFSYSHNATAEFTLGTALKEKTSALIVIPLIAFMEHITITKAFAEGARIDATQELLCLGVANIAGSFFSSMPVTGAFGRTALNHASGAQSPLGGLITGSIIILALVLLTPQFYYIPKSTLSSVVVMAVIFMVDLDILKSVWRSKRLDLLPWFVTFVVALFVGLEFGIMSGFVVSLIFLLYYASRPGIKVSKGETLKGHSFLWVEVDRSLTFPSMEYTRYALTKAALKWGGQDLPIVIDCRQVSFVDYTSATGVSDIRKLFKDKGQRLIFLNVKPSVRRVWDVVLGTSGANNTFFCSNEAELDLEISRCLKEEEAIKIENEGEVNNNFDAGEEGEE